MTENKTFNHDGKEFEIKCGKFDDEYHVSVFHQNKLVIKYSVSVEIEMDSKQESTVFGSPYQELIKIAEDDIKRGYLQEFYTPSN